MQNHLIFIFYLLVFLLSILGHGLIFSNLIIKRNNSINLGYIGLIGIFSISTISIFTSLLTEHNYLHNAIIHTVGIAGFIFYCFKYRLNQEIKKILFILIFFLIGIYIFKSHDDFPYYHLTYTLNLVENKFILGSGVFGHGFRTPSSLFFFHSTLYLPSIKYFLFNSGPFYILIFFNYVILNNILKSYKDKNFDLKYFFSLLSFAYVNIIFYRIAEHGVDRSAQVIFILITLLVIDILVLKEKNKRNETLLSILLILIFLSSTFKPIYLTYFIFIPILFVKTNLFSKLFLSKKKLIIVLLLSIFLNQTINFLSTGCFLYPEHRTCYEKTDWSIKKDEVKKLKVHYSWWAKAGGGSNYSVEQSKEEYVKNFNWVSNWFHRYFFNKVSDNLLGVLSISLIVISFFYSKKKNKNYKYDLFFLYMVFLVLGIEWFLNHPSLRYGGYVLLGVPILLFTSKILTVFQLSNKDILKRSSMLILLVILIFNSRNFLRIQKEIDVYKYPILQTPFFRVLEPKVIKIMKFDNLSIYSPLDQMCWAAPTPCTYNPNLNIKKFGNFYTVNKYDK